MAKTDKLVLEGVGEWCQIFEENRDREGYMGGAEEYGGQYCVDLILDQDGWSKLKAAGALHREKVSIDPPGMRAKFKRKHVLKFTKTDGEEIDNGGAPKVFMPDGTDWVYSENGTIGNGSTLKVGLSVFDTSKGRGVRLEWVKVLDLVVFVPAEEDANDEVPF